MKIFRVFKRIINRIGELSRRINLSLLYGRRIKCGKNLRLHRNTTIDVDDTSKIDFGENFYAREGLTIRVNNGELSIGNNVFFNNYCSVNVLNKLDIGDDCIFGEGVKIYDHNHNHPLGEIISKAGMKTKPVVIGNNCWIGSNAVILMGVHIGDNVIVGAGSVVFKDVESNCVYLQNGEKRIRN